MAQGNTDDGNGSVTESAGDETVESDHHAKEFERRAEAVYLQVSTDA